MNVLRTQRRLDRWDGCQVKSVVSQARKLRVLVAGDFAAGKARMINQLIGDEVLPTTVSAPSLPLVWVVRGGDRARLRTDQERSARPIEDIAELPLEELRSCLICHPAPILSRIDIVNMPDIAEPAMEDENWERMVDFADLVIWCSRSSGEMPDSARAPWDEMPKALRENPLMAVIDAERPAEAATRLRMMHRETHDMSEGAPATLMVARNDAKDIARVASVIDALTWRGAHPLDAAEPIDAEGAGPCRVMAFPKARRPEPRMPVRPRRILSARLIKGN